jgi:hypothetical protein
MALFGRKRPVLDDPYANHYFTAYFEDGRPSYVTVDG